MLRSEQKIFCNNCKQRLHTKTFLSKGDVIYEFEDGYYCEKCGKFKVDKARIQGK